MGNAFSQEIKIEGNIPLPADTLPPSPADSLPTLLPDSSATALPDSTGLPLDSSRASYDSDIETTINYNAKDSMYFDVVNKRIYLYGDAEIDYGEINLKAAEITIDWAENTLTAKGRKDSTGALLGRPIFIDAQDKFETEAIKYNFKTRKAIISGVTTEQGEGLVYGNTVKKNERDEVFINKGWYTTCDCEPGEVPDFYIKSSKLKLIPGDKVISGPFHMVIADVPTPLGLPFGLFPIPKRKQSGIIVPAYGEERERGFFLRNGGYYFAINDYIDLTLLGEIYSKGSYGVNVSSSYFKRYAYRGSLNFRYNRFRTNTDGSNPNESNDYRLTWNHTPQSKGNGRFSASVNIATSSFNQNNPTTNVNNNINAQLSSNISYSQRFQGTPFNASINLRHFQNLITEQIDVTLPNFALNMNRLYPFKSLPGRNSAWYKKINIGYRASGKNEITNKISSPRFAQTSRFDLANPEDFVQKDTILSLDGNINRILENARFGIRHSIPVSTSFNLLKHFTVSPSVNYEEIWYLEKLDYSYDREEQAVQVERIPGLSRLYSYSTSASVNTRLYGFYGFSRGPIRAIRHTLNPSVSFSYRPDFSDPSFDFFQEVQIDSTGRTEQLSRYEGFLFGGASRGESGSINMSLTNNFEMKIKDKQDTTGNPDATRKVSLLDNLSLSGSYNILADSFQLSNININARTKLLKDKINVTAQATLDPYYYAPRGTGSNGEVLEGKVREDELVWTQASDWRDFFSLGQITNASLSLNTNLRPRNSKKATERRDDIPEEEQDFIDNTYNNYVDFDIPWSLSLRYTVRYNRDLTEVRENRITQSLQFSGDLSITPKTKVNFTSGYDLENKEFTDTNISVYRDLDCFEMSFNWRPFGRFTSYSFQVNIKSSMLKDLKLQRRESFFDRGF